ncbi:glycosyltransferase [Thiohalobacter sp. IOR34]|uniref:glycosyltransferase n=1 Tax=Thiohalobacter sp. IOR34 TaxID=3057176 RepID=UPI0025B26B4B|nr:glycosyltransferase [Thiohalobacter sp. IOR34]WJW74445.1 glycosyltransferase [Thiohalobacter sp. IOR34]
MTDFSVVICTHDRVASLGRTLGSLRAAVRPEAAVDVLVIANACHDDSHSLLAELAHNGNGGLPLRWSEEPRPGKSYALNHAIERLQSGAAVFIDDDQRVAKDFLLRVAAALEAHPETGLFCGRLLPDWDGREPAWVHDTGPWRIYPQPVACFDAGDRARELGRDDELPPGGDIIVRRRVFDTVGGFATELGPHGHDLGGGEDIEFLRRALATGERLRYQPDIVQYHAVELHRLRTGHLLRKSFQRTRSSVRLHPRPDNRIPRYMARKLAVYAWHALFAWRWKKRRFYLVRLAAALGEIAGMREAPLARQQGGARK